MSRRSKPERIDAARHAAVRNGLISDGASPETADAWIAAWEAKAAQVGLERGSAYWQAGREWLALSVSVRRDAPGTERGPRIFTNLPVLT
jgi:hypothetical protein